MELRINENKSIVLLDLFLEVVEENTLDAELFRLVADDCLKTVVLYKDFEKAGYIIRLNQDNEYIIVEFDFAEKAKVIVSLVTKLNEIHDLSENIEEIIEEVLCFYDD